MKPIDKKGAVIGIIFGVISIIILIFLKAQGVFLVIILWMLVPVSIKKLLDKYSSRKEEY